MGRPSLQVDQNTLTTIIEDCEKNKTYSNRSELFADVAIKYSAQTQIVISPSVVYLRVNEFNIPLKTPKGKKGKTIIPKGERVKRGTKFALDSDAQRTFALLKKEIIAESGGRFLPVLKKAEQGSIKAILKLMCLTCANYQTNEIKFCQVFQCPLHPIRAYK